MSVSMRQRLLRRRSVWQKGLFGLGLIALLPAGIAAQAPVYIQNNLGASAVIFPLKVRRLRMNHQTPGHGHLACDQCHTLVKGSDSVRDNLIPSETACQLCHTAKLDRAQPTLENCGYCHGDFEPARPGVIAASVTAPARLHFSHRYHTARPASCIECHAATDTGEMRLPSMKKCVDCHQLGQRNGQCRLCHLANPARQLVTRFEDGLLKPNRALTGMEHGSDWTVRHRWVAADRGSVCTNCHGEKDCSRCHDGSRRPSAVHPNDWLTLHPQQSRRSSLRCTGCHTTQTFCAECHARLGISQLSAPDVRAGTRFHPPAKLWTRGLNRHATEAKRSLSSCVSCHAENDCVKCHASINEGHGSSPHPSGFSKQCANLVKRGSRACKTCHGNIERLLDRCD
jgi:hypothetical protein